MAVFIKDVEKTKCKEVGRNKEGAADQSIFGCQLLGQVNIKADEKKEAWCYLNASMSKGKAWYG